jgi:hypothetical protein
MIKRIFITISILALVACSSSYTTDGPMAGRPTRVDIQGYEEMCAREPDSELCNSEN